MQRYKAEHVRTRNDIEADFYRSGEFLPLVGYGDLNVYYQYNTGREEDWNTALFNVEEISEFVGQHIYPTDYFYNSADIKYGCFMSHGHKCVGYFVSYIGLMKVLFDKNLCGRNMFMNQKKFFISLWDKEVRNV